MKRRTRNTVLVFAVVLAVQAVAVGVYLAVEHGRTARRSPVFRVEHVRARPAPPIEVERMDGTRTTLADLRGRAVLVHFWATWCPPCVEELPRLLAASRRAGVTLLAISVDEGWEPIQLYFKGDVPAEIVRAVDADAHHRYDITALPDTYLVSGNGELALRYGGARDWRTDAALEHLAHVREHYD